MGEKLYSMKYSPCLFHLNVCKRKYSNIFRVLQNTKKGAKTLMENLVKKAKAGDSGAFAQLIRMNTQSMYKVAWAYLKNDEDVADAIQETILKCYEKLSALKNGFLLQNLDDSDSDQ